MADGLTTQTSTLATIPSGSKVATDDAGAAGHVQIVKLAVSTDGSAATFAPATEANQATVIGHLDGVETLLGTIATAAATLAGAVAGTEMQVDVLSTVQPTANATSAITSVADTTTSATLLSSSASRKGFRITNTSSAVLYVKYGTTASASDFTVRLPQWAYLEENFFSGRVDGVWASDPGDGAALITSLSA